MRVGAAKIGLLHGDEPVLNRFHDHVKMVHGIVWSMLGQLPADCRVDDLVQAGLVGLFDATLKYQPQPDAAFATYAFKRIQGAVLDSAREQDWLTRQSRRDMRAVAAAEASLRRELKREPVCREVAEKLGVSMAEFEAMRESAHCFFLSLDDHPDLQIPVNADPAIAVAAADLQDAIRQAITCLPARHRQVMIDHYVHDRSLIDIGQSLGVTSSRVSQMRAEAVKHLQMLFN